MKSIAIIITFLFSTLSWAIPTEPVMVGGEAEFDACGGYGIATVTTTVFTKNNQGYMKFDKIEASQNVFFCDSYKDQDGEYYGVVYSEKPGVSCNVSSPIPRRQPYKGPCKSGWVKKEFLLLLAG